MNKSTCANQFNNPSIIDNYRNKAKIPNTQCSILSNQNYNGLINCLNENEEQIVLNSINCGNLNDSNKLQCYQRKLKEYDCDSALCLLKKQYLLCNSIFKVIVT